MSEFFYYVLFLLLSLSILFKTIGYALYEINTLKNKYGGVVIIVFSTLVVILANTMIWIY